MTSQSASAQDPIVTDELAGTALDDSPPTGIEKVDDTGGQVTPPRRSAAAAWTLWILRRVLLAALTLFLVALLVYLGTSALGDPIRAILGKDFAVSPERVDTLRRELNLDAPLQDRFFAWLGGLFQGDLGESIANGQPVASLIADKVVNSAFLVLLATAVMIPLSMGFAMLSARLRGTFIDQAIQTITLALAGIPEFVTGILLVALFSTSVFHWLPAVTIAPPGVGVWARPASLVLPVATLVLAVSPYVTRILRSNMLEVLDSDYVELARLKGVPENRVLWKHTLPNTIVPAIQVTALQLAWLAGGVVLVEYLFSYPGIGAALVDSVRNSDFPMVQALAMIIAAVYVVVNLIADILSIVLTPRARTAVAG